MKIRFLGAAGEVTGSSFLVEEGDRRLLVDLGMFQGRGSGGKNRDRELVAKGVDGVILTHAHLDHSGRLPLLVDRGFKGRIWATKPTVDLAYLVLQDAVKVAEGNARYGEGVPLFTEEEVEQIMGSFEVVDYGRWKEVDEGIRFRLWDAGHILGSSSVELSMGERKVVFSGDLGNQPSPIVEETEVPKEAEVVVMESTYGNRSHPPRGEEVGMVVDLCKEIERTGGALLMPAFSIERTQELLLMFDHLKRQGEVSQGLAIYLDSPMGTKATAIYEKYPALFNPAVEEQKKLDDPFDFPGLIGVESGQESKRLDQTEGAKVIIAGSGMMAGGRIIFHARRWLPDPRTVILFTGFQAEGTLGRQVSDGANQVRIGEALVEVKARVEKVTSMSDHADQKQLLEWLMKIKGVKKVILVHGEEEARLELKKKIEREVGAEVLLPSLAEEIVV